MQYKYFIWAIYVISFFACKRQKNEVSYNTKTVIDTMYKSQVNTDKSILDQKVLKKIIIPEQRNNLVDSVVVFGSENNGSNYIDNIFVHFKNGIQKEIFKKGLLDFSGYEMYYSQLDDLRFAHFNSDNFKDLYFANNMGGSGGICYNVFLYNAKTMTFQLVSLLSNYPNLRFLKNKNHYLSIAKSGMSISAERFIVSKDSIKILSLFTSVHIGGGKADTVNVKYSYSKLGFVRLDDCYLILNKGGKIQKRTCSEYMENIEKQVWADWELCQ